MADGVEPVSPARRRRARAGIRDKREYHYEDRYLTDLRRFFPLPEQPIPHTAHGSQNLLARKKDPDRNISPHLSAAGLRRPHTISRQEESTSASCSSTRSRMRASERYGQDQRRGPDCSRWNDLKGTFPRLPVDRRARRRRPVLSRAPRAWPDFGLSIILSGFNLKNQVPERIQTRNKGSEGMKRLKEMIKEIQRKSRCSRRTTRCCLEPPNPTRKASASSSWIDATPPFVGSQEDAAKETERRPRQHPPRDVPRHRSHGRSHSLRGSLGRASGQGLHSSPRCCRDEVVEGQGARGGEP